MTWGNVTLWIAASAGRVSLVDKRLTQPGELLFVGRGHGLHAVALGTMEFVAPLVQDIRLLFAVFAEEDESLLVFVSEEPDGAACASFPPAALLEVDEPLVPEAPASPLLAAY